MFKVCELCRGLRRRGPVVTNFCGDGNLVAGRTDTGTGSCPRAVFARAALANGADRNFLHPGRAVVCDLRVAMVEGRQLGRRQDWLAVTRRGTRYFVFSVITGGCYCRVDVGVP